MLFSNNPYNNFDFLDLTGNELTKELEEFVEVLRKIIVPLKRIEELILVDNRFDKSIISIIKGATGSKIRKIYI